MSDFTLFREKMEQAKVNEVAIKSFERNYKSLLNQETGMISEESISPVSNLTHIDSLSSLSTTFNPKILAKTVVIKLNGGLGTSMGLQKAKSLLPVKNDKTFLDIIIEQIAYLRESTGAKVKFLLMNSFCTSEDTLDHLEQYEDINLAKAEDIEIIQNQIPKIDAHSLTPASNTDNSASEWCPPGHGDIYAALAGSGWLDKLLDAGIKYAFISNADNLGAILEPSILNYFIESNQPFLMEATRRTEADKKGGHLAVRNSDNQLLLREVAQCPEEDLESFQNVDTHQFFNTNNLWIRLDAIKEALETHGGSLPLPMIKNSKTIDSRDKQSTPVFQLETAMGAAIECFSKASAICVPRSRFAPVKTTSDLFAIRSDAYETTKDGRIALIVDRKGKPPIINLSDEYKMVDILEGLGTPSLKNATKVSISGPVRFAENVTIKGIVSFKNDSKETKWVASGVYTDEEVSL